MAQHTEDKANELRAVLKGNIKVLESLSSFYDRLLGNDNFPLRASGRRSIVAFVQYIQDRIHDTEMHRDRAELLVKLVDDRKNLVSRRIFMSETLDLCLIANSKGRYYSIYRARLPKRLKI